MEGSERESTIVWEGNGRDAKEIDGRDIGNSFSLSAKRIAILFICFFFFCMLHFIFYILCSVVGTQLGILSLKQPTTTQKSRIGFGKMPICLVAIALISTCFCFLSFLSYPFYCFLQSQLPFHSTPTGHTSDQLYTENLDRPNIGTTTRTPPTKHLQIRRRLETRDTREWIWDEGE